MKLLLGLLLVLVYSTCLVTCYKSPGLSVKRSTSSLYAAKYCEDVHRPKRRPTRTCTVGDVQIGSKHPIAKQTMTTTNTRDVEKSVEQIIKIAKEGAQLARLTVQGRFEADA